MKVAVLATGFVLLATSFADAQRRRQRGQRGFGGFGGGTFGQLATNEYLQKEMKLTSSQITRMKEINYQMQGARALTSEEVMKTLGVSDTQKTKIEEARRKPYEGLRDLFRRGQGGKRPNFDEIRKKMEDARKKSDEAVLTILTSAQKNKWKKMLGKPIDRSKLSTRRGSGGTQPKRKRPDV